MGLSYDNLANSPLRITLQNNTTGQSVKGLLSDSIKWSATANYEDVGDQMLTGMRFGNVANVVGQGVLNQSTISSAFTYQKWTGSEMISFEVPLTFIAVHSDAQVQTPMRVLISWTSPPDSTGTLLQPPIKRGKYCSLIGPYFRIVNCLIPKDVNIDPSNAYTIGGSPIKANITVTLVTYKSMLGSEVQGWFN